MRITSYSCLRMLKADHTTSMEAIKKQYRRLVMTCHPDRGGNEEDMKRLNAEYDFCKTHNFNVYESKNGGTYTKQEQDRPDDVTERFKEIIDALIKLDGVGIEICGSFVWLDGNTYEHRAAIKALGARWASKKRKWFIAPTEWKKQAKREFEMEEIRARYGSQVVREGTAPTMRPAIAAA